MTDRGGWLRHAAEAARIAADRGDLWLPGALGALPYLAWLPLLLTVAGAPRTSDFAFLGAGLFSSDLFPLNVLLIATLAALGVLVAFLVAALAEATLLRSGPGTPDRPLTRDLEAVFSVMLVAALPAVGVAAAVVSGVAVVAPGEFGSPDLGIPLALRIALHLVPLLVLLAILAWAGQAVAAVAMRRAMGPESLPIGQAIRASLRDISRYPVRRLGLALVALLADLLAVALAVALLGVLWAPIGDDLRGGELVSPSGLLLLVGFVAIWLAIVLAFGALHVWASTWWSLELGATVEAGQPEAEEARP
ncbi:MAG TPA: hypothetical protein VIM66_04995 [Candidatus Limnocylindria bacterium]|jgi:hypothetical protein